LSDLLVLTADPAIKTLADLKGKQIAADMGSGQYQILAIYAASKGLDLKKDITVVNANFAVARAQLAAGRVEAAMVIEPIATMMMRENPNLKPVFEANKAWKELTGSEGWELVYAMREDSIKRVPAMPKMFLGALQDVSAFLKSSPDEADKIASETVKLPPGVLKEAVASGRWAFDAKPAWGDERKVIWNMLERAVQAGFHPKVPDDAFIYVP
jgi:ABC-type nitrate/sulfonate/bicarbonate transport system substrate-binding protein